MKNRTFGEEWRQKISVSKRGEKHHMWKGGITKDAAGYIYVKSPDHPLASSKWYYPQHRLKMEQQLGRLLTDDEVVHHKNGKKDDNRLENLLLLTKSEHRKLHMTLYHYEHGHRLKETPLFLEI